MKRTFILLAACLATLALSACSLSLLRAPAPLPTPISLSTPIASLATPSSALPAVGLPTAPSALVLPAVTPVPAGSTALPGVILPTAAPGAILPGAPSGPYGVIQVAASGTLNVRSAAGTGNSVISTFSATANNVMRTGPSTNLNKALWAQVTSPGGGTGWVDSTYLTEYVPPAAFCTDGRVNALLTNFGNAVKGSDGAALSPLVSPDHGMSVRLWRNGSVVVFDQAHTQWILTSSFSHDWGAAPASGLDTAGSFHAQVLPKWLDVLNGSYTSSCNSPQTGGASYDTSWPKIYTNINFYSLYKPGPAGNENSWRTLLVGVEYVQNQPYLFSVTQLQWEP
jgi:hypothetical protein